MREQSYQVLNVKQQWICHPYDHGRPQGQQDCPLHILALVMTNNGAMMVTFDDVDTDPVGGGVGGDTGVVATVLRSAVAHC